jgi:hypothetical protein
MGVVIGTCVPAADEGPVLEEEEDDEDVDDHQQLQALQTLQLHTFRLVADSRFLCGWKITLKFHFWCTHSLALSLGEASSSLQSIFQRPTFFQMGVLMGHSN